MKVKKMLSLILATAMILSVCASFATVITAAETPVFVRMDYDSVNSTLEWSYDKSPKADNLTMKSDGDARSAYYEMTETTKKFFHPLISLPREVKNGEKVILSFDYKVANYADYTENGTPGVQIQYWDENREGGIIYNEVGSLNTSSAWGGHWTNGAPSAAKATDTWARYDFVVDNQNQKVSLYHNGSFMQENGNVNDKGVNTVITDIRLNFWTPGTVSVDNITAATTDALTANNATVKVNGKNMYVNYPATIADDSVIPTSAYIEEVGGTTKIYANAVSQSTKGIIKLELASEPKKNTEYRVVYNDEANIKSFLGGSMNGDVTYIKTEKETVDIVKETFSDWPSKLTVRAEEGKPDVVVNVPENYSFLGKCWNTDNIGVQKEAGNETNSIIRIANESSAEEQKFMVYSLPENMPAKYTLNVSYKIKTNLETVTGDQGNGIITGIDSTDYGTEVNVTGLSNAAANIMFRLYGGKGIYYPTGSGWWGASPYTEVKSESETENGIWYQIDMKYDVVSGSSVVPSYTIKKGGAKTTDTFTQIYNGEKVGLANASKVKKIQNIFICLYQAKKDVSELYIDDFNVSYTVDTVSLLHTRMLDAQGETIMPSKTPENTISGMQFTLSDKVDGVTAKLDGENATVTQNDNVYKVTWDNFLSAEKHTVELTYGTNTYTYEFTPTVAEELITKSFGAYIGDKAAEKADLTAGATVTVKAKVANPTGDATKTVCIMYALYDGDAIKSVNYENKTVGTSVQGEDIDISFSVPSGITNPNLKIFLWDAIDGMIPLTNSAEI